MTYMTVARRKAFTEARKLRKPAIIDTRQFPVAPLLLMIDRRMGPRCNDIAAGMVRPGRLNTDEEVAAYFGISRSAVLALSKKASMGWEAADRWAGRVGVHPVDIWPDWFDEVVFDEEVA